MALSDLWWATGATGGGHALGFALDHPCTRFCACSKLLAAHYTSIPLYLYASMPLYLFTFWPLYSPTFYIIQLNNLHHFPHCPFTALGKAAPWCVYRVHPNDRAEIGWGRTGVRGEREEPLQLWPKLFSGKVNLPEFEYI